MWSVNQSTNLLCAFLTQTSKSTAVIWVVLFSFNDRLISNCGQCHEQCSIQWLLSNCLKAVQMFRPELFFI